MESIKLYFSPELMHATTTFIFSYVNSGSYLSYLHQSFLIILIGNLQIKALFFLAIHKSLPMWINIIGGGKKILIDSFQILKLSKWCSLPSVNPH